MATPRPKMNSEVASIAREARKGRGWPPKEDDASHVETMSERMTLTTIFEQDDEQEEEGEKMASSSNNEIGTTPSRPDSPRLSSTPASPRISRNLSIDKPEEEFTHPEAFPEAYQ
jgi:hypothetical protein